MTDKRYSMPETRHGLPAFECLSAMQKCIRRAMEREAMEFAVELIHTSKAYTTMVCNRLEIVSHEDIDSAKAPHVIPFVRTCCEQARAWYDATNGDLSKSRMAVGNAIRAMCRAPKSREGDHFQAAIGGRSLLEGFCPTVPDWALDQHTARGKRMGRGFDHFLSEGAKLVPPPEKKDVYEDEAHRQWLLQERMKAGGGAATEEHSAAQLDLRTPATRKPHDLGAAAADAEQGKLALDPKPAADPDLARPLAASLPPAVRKQMAERLYCSGDWTMDRIAKALGVSQATITGDLKRVSMTNKPPRPRGGRPKGH